MRRDQQVLGAKVRVTGDSRDMGHGYLPGFIGWINGSIEDDAPLVGEIPGVASGWYVHIDDLELVDQIA